MPEADGTPKQLIVDVRGIRAGGWLPTGGFTLLYLEGPRTYDLEVLAGIDGDSTADILTIVDHHA